MKNVVEGALLAAGRSMSLDGLQALFLEDGQPDKGQLRRAIETLQADYAERSIEIKETASGYRIQVKQEYSEWVSRLWEERPTRYSRALLETLALVAYRQPITRGEIEDVRGVSVSTSIMRTLQERDWVRVVGHRDVPGRPAMYGTTKTFLDYFGLKALDELPTLSELRDIDSINVELDLREKGGDEQRTAELKDRDSDDNSDDVDADTSAEAVAGEDAESDPPRADDLDADVDVDDEALGVSVGVSGEQEDEDSTVEETATDVDTDRDDDMNEQAGAGHASQEEGFEGQVEERTGSEDTGASDDEPGKPEEGTEGGAEEDDNR
ncbi:MAG: SMC-Scp complex subunit ScpB [Gammaproteobacteria bacterium]|nr:SMC-Scp complex subunit ScpB [Gammaproteobacteria bacterium]